MNVPKIDIKQFITKEEASAKAWMGTNWAPFSVGAGTALTVVYLLHLVKLI